MVAHEKSDDTFGRNINKNKMSIICEASSMIDMEQNACL